LPEPYRQVVIVCRLRGLDRVAPVVLEKCQVTTNTRSATPANHKSSNWKADNTKRPGFVLSVQTLLVFISLWLSGWLPIIQGRRCCISKSFCSRHRQSGIVIKQYTCF